MGCNGQGTIKKMYGSLPSSDPERTWVVDKGQWMLALPPAVEFQVDSFSTMSLQCLVYVLEPPGWGACTAGSGPEL